MDSNQQAEVEALLEAALELPPEDRAAFLRRECSTEEVRKEVEALIGYAMQPTGELHGGFLRSIEQGAVELLAGPDFAGTERFEIQGRLGAGAFGTVYDAYDRLQQIPVALKTLNLRGGTPDGLTPESLHRKLQQFRSEFRSLADVAHHNLVRLYEFFVHEDQWFFTMEKESGVDFITAVRQRPERSHALLLQLARGVAELHRLDTLHCDLKPSNVLVTPEARVVILDLGLARGIRRAQNEPLIFGTPRYVSPEQSAGLPLSPASDWYSVGVMLRDALTGTAPVPPLARLIEDMVHADPAWRPPGDDIVARLQRIAATAEGLSAAAGAGEELFVGRDTDLTQLRAAFAEAEFSVSVQLVAGPPGIGKTTLLTHAVEQFGASGALVLHSSCRERESVPFKAFEDLVEGIGRYRQSGRWKPDLPASDLRLIGRLFPALEEPAAPEQTPSPEPFPHDPIELRRKSFDAFGRFLRDLSLHERLVIWIDDAQWGDRDSARLLRHLLEGSCMARGLLLLSFRADEGRGSEFLNSIRQVAIEPVRRIDIGPLNDADGRCLARSLLGSNAQIELVAGVAKESGGDPYLLVELARYAVAHGSALASSSATLEQVVSERVQSLSATARAVLKISALGTRALDWRIARVAAEAAADGYDALLMLRAERLLRSFPDHAGIIRVECYHDRVGEVVRKNIGEQEARLLHGRIATALERLAPDDAEAMAGHFAASQDPVRAETYAEIAGDRAVAAMAFETAVTFYRMCRRDSHIGLRLKLAGALATSGRALETAELFEEIAARHTGIEALRFNMSAARYYLASGHLERGMAVIHGVLKVAGMRMPATPLRAVLASLPLRVRAWAAERRWRANPERFTAEPPLDVLIRMEACGTVAFGLSLLDPVFTAAFHARYLLLSLQWGNNNQRARAFTLYALYLSSPGRRSTARSDRLLRDARGFPESSLDAEAQSLVRLSPGLEAYLKGDFRSCVESLERVGLNLNGSPWELLIGRSAETRARYYAGDIATLFELVPSMCKDADARGNVFEAITLRCRLCVLDLFQTRSESSSRAILDLARTAVSKDRFRLPNYWIMISDVDMALYAEELPRAWTLIDESWVHIQKAWLLHAQFLRIELHSRRGLAAVCMSSRLPRRRALLRVAERDQRVLAREGTRWATGLSEAIAASIAFERNDREAATARMASALVHFESGEMALYAASSRRRLGQLRGGTEGEALITAADSWMRSQGIAEPAHAARMVIPFPA